MSDRWFGRCLLWVLLILLGGFASAWAGEDARFTIELPLVEGEVWQDHLDDAMARLLDRLLPDSERGRAHLTARRYLLSAVPSDNSVRLHFRAQAVFDALTRAGFHPLRSPPHIRLQMTMEDPYGMAMPQTLALLRQEAARAAMRWGMVLDSADGQPLGLHWQWLDDRWVFLAVVSSEPELAALSGEDAIDLQQPMVSISMRLHRVLQRARELAVMHAGEKDQQPVGEPSTSQPVFRQIVLRLMVPASLAEQVGLEQVLAAVPQVATVMPQLLSRSQQVYRLQVRDTAWIPDWFASRGMQAVPGDAPDEWVVR